MTTSGTLQDKRAVVFGGGGAIGGAVAQELAAEGAEVFVAGRSPAGVELVAKEITAAGGRAHADVVDALDEAAVDAYLDAVVERAGGIDVELNATGPSVGDYGHGKPALELPVDELMTAFRTVLRSQFVTARAAARRMVAQGSGVVVFLTATPARVPYPGALGIGATYGAVESLMRTMALELGPAGVRAVCLRTHANPDTPSIRDSVEGRARRAGIGVEQVLAGLAEGTMLKALPSTADTARAAAFLASDAAGLMTGTVLNFSAGAFAD